MELPKEADFYIHRSGRSGRGKYTGICYSMYDTSDEENLKNLREKRHCFKNMTIKMVNLLI